KTSALLKSKGKPSDRRIAIQTKVDAGTLEPNPRTGLGRSVPRSWIQVGAVYFIEDGEIGTPVLIEEVCSASLRLLQPEFVPYERLRPRSVSLLPVAVACEAACPFCFSKASVSLDQAARVPDLVRARDVLSRAKGAGAGRAVITGGGEPGMLGAEALASLVAACADCYDKVVLITNGFFLSKGGEFDRLETLSQLGRAGLRVLAISRHHFEAGRNAALMRLDARAEETAALLSSARRRQELRGLTLRWICVLQKGGVDSPDELGRYLSWAVKTGAAEVCFKELYVATSHESVYHSRPANEWSARHQVPLNLVVAFARERGWRVAQRLPWGAPIYEGRWDGHPVRVAAYTEPSLFWERSQGVSRSWNMMADGTCLASLEDRRSEVLPR
ncbi:MAG: radical SAM protein, partial [Elusimicrobia bacterium]|nr:radical SAM protein [Elusimicrobiota bacterium]